MAKEMKKKLMKLVKNPMFWVVSIALIVGVVLFLVGGHLAGWDIAGWFTSPTAWLCYLILAVAVVWVGFTLILRRDR